MGKILPYAAVFLMIFGFAKIGVDSKNDASGNSISMSAIVADDFKVSADQLTELYVVASLSDSMNLASTDTVASNYVVVSVMKEINQTASDRIEKPNFISTGISRGVQTYVVDEGETMTSIALRFGITTDQIRWSNGLKTTEVSVGQVLQVPTVPGIVYKVKAGDTVDSLASKYGSTVENIVAYNDLETLGLAEGATIVLPWGTLPVTERPEYVAPSRSSSYTYAGSSAARQNVQVVAYGFYDAQYPYPTPNPGVPGWCTWYAWWWRATSPLSLGTLGHEGRDAKWWHINYAYRGVGRIPRVGAVFQTSYGGSGYGHVGVVVAVNDDGSIVVREMNYAGRYIVTEGTIPAAYVGNFNYIY